MLMAALGPFERRPRLAVAVSGGADSLALCLLAARWARARDGDVVGLIVDHGLRAGSAAEAAQVGAWLEARGIPHRILVWSDPKPSSGIQAAARAARYRLLEDWCRAAGILHLLLAHHRDDQAETVALRAARRSGPDGLAGMAPVRERPGLRLLRPLLRIPRTALRAFLQAEGQPWLEDPSNLAEIFARGRLRADGDLDVTALVARSARCAVRRAAHDRAVAMWLARHARIDPAGFVWLDHREFAAAPVEFARRLLQQALVTIGGTPYPPRRARLDRLLEDLRHAGEVRGRTLNGCLVVSYGARLLICREPGAISDQFAPPVGRWQIWDRRFAVRLLAPLTDVQIRALGPTGRRRLAELHSTTPAAHLPAPVLPGLPALWQGARLLAVPHLGLCAPALAGRAPLAARLRPPQPLAGAPFAARAYGRSPAWRGQAFASRGRSPILSSRRGVAGPLTGKAGGGRRSPRGSTVTRHLG